MSDTPTARGGELFEAAFYDLFLVKLSHNVAVMHINRQESHSSGQFSCISINMTGLVSNLVKRLQLISTVSCYRLKSFKGQR